MDKNEVGNGVPVSSESLLETFGGITITKIGDNQFASLPNVDNMFLCNIEFDRNGKIQFVTLKDIKPIFGFYNERDNAIDFTMFKVPNSYDLSLVEDFEEFFAVLLSLGHAKESDRVIIRPIKKEDGMEKEDV